jgi:hypothetical protein
MTQDIYTHLEERHRVEIRKQVNEYVHEQAQKGSAS